jgi:hypothetical protein
MGVKFLTTRSPEAMRLSLPSNNDKKLSPACVRRPVIGLCAMLMLLLLRPPKMVPVTDHHWSVQVNCLLPDQH